MLLCSSLYYKTIHKPTNLPAIVCWASTRDACLYFNIYINIAQPIHTTHNTAHWRHM